MFDSSKDPAFTLFGRKIPLSDGGEPPPIHYHGQDLSSENEKQPIKDQTVDEHESVDDSENFRNLETGQEADEKPAKPDSEKTLKKPDKLLPCPRCKSMDSKFCYFNNYNVNQPRHFCKACQRYWTAGGTMRNVAVGAGRRKSKSSASFYRQIDVPNGTHNPKFISNNSRVLCFNLEAQNSEPIMGSVLNLAESPVLSNGVKKVEEKGSESSDKSSSLSSMAVQSSLESPIQKNNGFPSQISYLSGNQWPFVWNSSVPPPTFFSQGFPLSFFPVGAWNCGGLGPWFSPQVSSSSLGKHQRENEMEKEEESSSKQRNGCVLTPKTSRIDDLSEAAKSSIWATLGIKNESITNGKNLFKTFQSNGHDKVHGPQTSSVLQANPAALSRSLVFRESS